MKYTSIIRAKEVRQKYILYDLDVKFRTNLWCWMSEYQNMAEEWRKVISDWEGT